MATAMRAQTRLYQCIGSCGAVITATTCAASDVDRISATCDLWATSVPAPDVLIAMNASARTLHERIQRRGRAMETDIDEQDLSN